MNENNLNNTFDSPLQNLKNRMQFTAGITTAPNKSEGFTVNLEEINEPDIIEEIKIAENTNAEEEKEITEEKAEDKDNTLLKKMKRYTVDDDGVDVSEKEEPVYKLEPVKDIIEQSDKKGIDFIPEGAEITVDDLGKSAQETPEEPEEVKEEIPETEETNESKEQKEDLTKTTTFISDIDSTDNDYIVDKPATSNTATIRFTPIKDGKMSVSSMTKPIDLSKENPEQSEDVIKDELNETQFEEVAQAKQESDNSNNKKLLVLLAKKKRNRFLSTVLSFALFIALLCFSFVSKPNILACTILLGVSILANLDMFTSFPKLFTPKCDGNVMAALSCLCVFGLGIYSYIKEFNTYYAVLTASFILSVRCLMAFNEVSTLAGNLRVIASNRTKNAVCLISDKQTALAMAENSIEGNVLIAGSRKVKVINDFMKYSKFSNKLSGKMTYITVLAVILSAVTGIIAGYLRHNLAEGLYAAAAVLCLFGLPSLYFIDNLTLKSAASRLNKTGAMITGFAAAEKLEIANAVVVSTADIFPAGSVTLQSMKVLADNNVDEILMRSASLTEALDSPLCPIFKQIAGTNSDYQIPGSDTVKYVEKMGISGWVDDELLFIGNRTLLESHGIAVPSVEIDNQILAKGYFPVYVATDNKACVLLVVDYKVKPSIAKELRKTADLGVTLLFKNTDPNITTTMISDYFGIYDDCIHVMTSAGRNMCRNATAPHKVTSSPAAYEGSTLNMTRIMTCVSRMHTSNLLLTVTYILAAVLGIVYFLYTAFSGKTELLSKAPSVLYYGIISTVITAVLYLIKKP